ncbi:hypothetical protein F2Q70_00020793 [Brassica cretica]|uniref:Uncharacterized protein n=1 Tax=Brassica cretica TaxID=69181 RepID=A0A8S9GRE5_BRACR|nr:hypothetical protein F2Q70_00020793 [Brassica cretica]
MGATSRSDAMRSLQTTSQSDLAGATPRSRSPFHPGGSRKRSRSDLSERPLQVAPEAQSDLARVTPRGRSHFYRVTTTQWSRSDLSERPTEVAPEARSDVPMSLRVYLIERGSEVPQRRHEVALVGSDVIRATDPSRSHFRCQELESRSWSNVSQRPREVARVFGDWERLDQSDWSKSLHFRCPELESRSRSDVTQRPREVARDSVDQSDVFRATPPSCSPFRRHTTGENDPGATSCSDTLKSLPSRSRYVPLRFCPV